jgi:DNA-binding protein Fis
VSIAAERATTPGFEESPTGTPGHIVLAGFLQRNREITLRVIEFAPSMTLKRTIAKLEKQRRDLNEIITTLRDLEAFGPHKSHYDISFDEFEKRLVEQALKRAGGNQTEAARILHLTRDRMRGKIAKHGLN